MGLLHGRLKTAEKESVMEAFRRGEVNILVSTTVIEVGVDVPNATVMAIEQASVSASRSCTSLRGRVGRGAEQSYCIWSRASSATPAGNVSAPWWIPTMASTSRRWI